MERLALAKLFKPGRNWGRAHTHPRSEEKQTETQLFAVLQESLTSTIFPLLIHSLLDSCPKPEVNIRGSGLLDPSLQSTHLALSRFLLWDTEAARLWIQNQPERHNDFEAGLCSGRKGEPQRFETTKTV